MVTNLVETPCMKCTKTGCIATCSGCEQSFCTRHFIKHRLFLSQQADELHDDYDQFRKDLNRNKFEHSFLSSIDTWEQNAMIKIQQTADKARKDFQQWLNTIRQEIKTTLKQIVLEFESNATADNYTETELNQWKNQLVELRNLIEKPTTISIKEVRKSSSFINEIKIVQKSSNLMLHTSENDIQKSLQERFRLIFGPCKLSEDKCIATHSNYRAGLSQISGINEHSSGRHSIRFLIENKGTKNIFLGIYSSSKQILSQSLDYSVHGWWNLDYVIINGESSTGDQNEIIQTGDELTLIIDCDNQQIQLNHHRTETLVNLSVKLHFCPFPWKLLVRLLSAEDCIRILN
ncbi:hypothetical protein I4U23_018374 [Adineta vaga]|nr:hypothetical protein I4U23_018374 [Adineta vaga]